MAGETLGLVPTMGALHEGHLSLVRAARAANHRVAVSIFVNPTQFGPSEDFARYPRTLERDLSMLEAEGVDMVFAPAVEEMYPPGAPVAFVDVPGVSERLDGASRPGHFRGVATVVSKLFHIVEPERAYFGQKDAAQVAVLRAMVKALDFPVELIACPTVRDPDGLALSSRNRYLSAAEREAALALPLALERAALRADQGAEAVQGSLRGELLATESLRVDYAEVIDPDTLLPLNDLSRGALVAAAVWVGQTRLIDNVLLAPVRQEAFA